MTCWLFFRVNRAASKEGRGNINVGLYITTRKVLFRVVNGCACDPTKRVNFVYLVNNLIRVAIKKYDRVIFYEQLY